MGEAANRLVDALQTTTGDRPRRSGRGWSARCPTHEDRKPSLSVTPIEGKVLVHCHAGCDTRDVLAALQLDVRDLFDEPRGSEYERYQYTDAAGRLTRTVHRLEGKEFRQSGDLSVAQLYRLPAVLDAVAAGTMVFLVEGEKDVHALEACGVVATTGPQGSSSFGKVDVSPLKGAQVVAVVDRDAAGQKWAAEVRRRLDGYARSLVFVEATTGKDAADHIAAGGNPGTFAAVAPRPGPAQVTEPDPDASQNLLAGLRTGDWLDAQSFAPLRYAVPGLLPEGSSLLVGPPKVGKSWAVLDLLLAIACGGRALGAIPIGDKRPVLYLALEDGDRRMQDRCRRLLAGDPIPREFHYLTSVPHGRVVDVVAAWTDRYPDAAAVVLDTLGKVMPPAFNGESQYQRDYRVGGALKRLADERPGLALLTNHHDRKAESSDFVDAVSGTNGLAGAADSIILLTRSRLETAGTVKVTGRDVAEGEYAVRFTEGCTWQLEGGSLAAAAARAIAARGSAGLGDRSSAIVALVAERGEVRAADVAAALDIEEKHAGEYLRRLARSERIAQLGRGRFGLPTPPTPPVGSVGSVVTDPTLPTQTTPPHSARDARLTSRDDWIEGEL